VSNWMRIARLGFETGRHRKEWPLNEGQRTPFRGVRVVLDTDYNVSEGLRGRRDTAARAHLPTRIIGMRLIDSHRMQHCVGGGANPTRRVDCTRTEPNRGSVLGAKSNRGFQ
jgi:hypothetical protein